ncbi:hypothetical protein [Halobacillus sp. A5]|nr:hypothetical protein [Halobacillus sp. A5]
MRSLFSDESEAALLKSWYIDEAGIAEYRKTRTNSIELFGSLTG